MLATTPSEPVRTPHTLLPLKLHAPPPRVGVLLRHDLQSLLSEVRLNPVTLVVAPAGYGKTTLLVQWVQELSRTGAPSCWLTLDGSERDPALFLAYLIGVFQTHFPAIGGDAWRILHSAPNLERDWPMVAGSLCGDLQRKLPIATFLFLDDLHLVADSAVISQILGYLLRAAPPTLHVVLAARRAPAFAPLGRLRAEGQVVEVSQRDLHLAPAEVQHMLAAQDVQLGDEALQVLIERTEGWALSVQLAARALAAQPPARREEFVRALGGSQEQLLQYLASEVLSDLPSELIDFLCLAAIPASFDADLLTEVLQRDDSRYLLQRARALGLPILPMDEQGDRLRFHPLWRELLLRSIPDMLDEDTLQAFHRRFGHVFEARGDLEGAIDHYAAAAATDDLVRALRERAWPLLHSPRRDMVRRWLDQLPSATRENDPGLLHMWGVSLVGADPTAARDAIERARGLYRAAGLHERELRALGDLAEQMLWQQQLADLNAVCRQAIEVATHVGDAWSSGAARVCVVGMLYNQGRDVAALRVARQAVGQPVSPPWRWMLAMIAGTVGVRLGRPAEALALVDEALRVPFIDLDDRLRQNLLRIRAMALYQQGHTAEGLSLAIAAHRHIVDFNQGAMVGHSAMQLALMLTLHGRLDEAATYLSQARMVFNEIGVVEPLAGIQALELYGGVVRGQAPAAGEVAGVLRRLQESGGRAPDLQLLLALTFEAIGEGRRALALAQETIGAMQARGYRQLLACAWLYAGYLAGLHGEAALREEALRAGWDIVAADGYSFLPMLPAAAVRDVVVAALRGGIPREAVGRVLSQQLPDQSVALLQELLAEPAAPVRASVARLLGDMGAIGAYPALRPLLRDRDAAVRQAVEDALGRLVYRPPYTLRIRTLGAFALWRGDQEVRDRDWRSSKARQLFQILMTERGRTLPRDRVLDMLWPEMEAEAAANNLRVTLNRLSKAIEPDRPDGAPLSYIVQQGDTYSFNVHSDYQIDATDFAAAVAEGQAAEQRGQRQLAVTAYRRAIGLYGGPYLPDNMYEDWTAVERERLMLLFDDAAIRLGSLLLAEGLAHEAIGLAWRVLENDGANEEAYRLLMRAHAHLGERSTALRLYARCATVLRTELGVEPLPETTTLFNTLREMGESRPDQLPTAG